MAAAISPFQPVPPFGPELEVIDRLHGIAEQCEAGVVELPQGLDHKIGPLANDVLHLVDDQMGDI
ncbi:hypothetical protein [Georgenia sp. SUBG003]|uniref:hypothetical protein n=1 Tax=Georgenia sp. SUBG003 TaxID=1497974 RepID=UPI003AB40D30